MKISRSLFITAFTIAIVGCGDDGHSPLCPCPPPAIGLCLCDEIDPTPTPAPDPIVTPTATPAPTATPELINPVCNGIQKSYDGPGGFLWKPVSESDGNLAVHFPGKFQKPFDSVKVTRKGGKIENLRYVGKGNPDSNGDRLLYRGSAPGQQYKALGLVEAQNGADNLCTWKIDYPSQRID